MRRLSGWDAYMLYSETPTVHNHTLKVAVVGPDGLGRSLTFEQFHTTFASYLPLLTPLRFKLVDVPAGLHHPMWRENCAVDLEAHLIRGDVAQPGGQAELDAVVGEIASIPLDRRLPLWAIHFIEGLSGGRVAIIAKVHHALADGVASANLMARAVTESPHTTSRIGHVEADPQPTRSEVVRAALRDYRRSARLFPRVVVDTASGSVRMARHAKRSLPEDAKMLRAPATFFNRKLTARRGFGTASLGLPAVKAIAREVDATINDVVLALTAGALRQAVLDQGEVPEALVAAVAVATDRRPDRIDGNRLTALMTSLPCDEPDPIARCERVKASTAVAKHNLDLLGMGLVEQWMEFIWPKSSTKLFRTMSSRSATRNRLVNLPMSNVPGPRRPGYVAGFPMVELYSVGPLYDRCGLNVTVWSYVDQLNVSVLSDPALAPDPARIAGLIKDGLDELRSALDDADSHA